MKVFTFCRGYQPFLVTDLFQMIIKLTDPNIFTTDLKQMIWETTLTFTNTGKLQLQFARRIKLSIALSCNMLRLRTMRKATSNKYC